MRPAALGCNRRGAAADCVRDHCMSPVDQHDWGRILQAQILRACSAGWDP